MKRTPIDGSFPWERWASDAADIEQLDRRQAARLLFDTLAINRFEHALLELKNAGAVWGPVHTSVGQEATASAAVAALRPSDKMAATYRAHHQFLAKVLQAQVPADWDPAAGELPEQAQEVFYRTMAEIMGLAPGYCGGRGGSMHLRHNESGFLGSNAIVGGGVPLAAGAAYAEKFAGTGNVVVCYIGDGAVNQGAFHEACNLAGLWSLPLIVFVENNRYAVATRVQDACAVEHLSQRASAYAMEGFIVDGDDAIAIYGLVREVAGRLRDGGTPAIIECECYPPLPPRRRRARQRLPLPHQGGGGPVRRHRGDTRAAAHPGGRRVARPGGGGGHRRAGGAGGTGGASGVHGSRRPAARARELVAGSRHGGRRHAQRRHRARRPALRRPAPGRTGARADALLGRDRGGDRPLAGAGGERDRLRRGGGQPGRRRLRGHQGAGRAVPGPPYQHPDLRGRLLRAGLRRRHAGHARGGGDHVRGLRAGGSRSALQPALEGAPHVRRYHRPADRGAQPRRHRPRLRRAAFDGPGRPVRDVSRLPGSSHRPTRTTISVCSTPPCTRSIRS